MIRVIVFIALFFSANGYGQQMEKFLELAGKDKICTWDDKETNRWKNTECVYYTNDLMYGYYNVNNTVASEGYEYIKLGNKKNLFLIKRSEAGKTLFRNNWSFKKWFFLESSGSRPTIKVCIACYATAENTALSAEMATLVEKNPTAYIYPSREEEAQALADAEATKKADAVLDAEQAQVALAKIAKRKKVCVLPPGKPLNNDCVYTWGESLGVFQVLQGGVLASPDGDTLFFVTGLQGEMADGDTIDAPIFVYNAGFYTYPNILGGVKKVRKLAICKPCTATPANIELAQQVLNDLGQVDTIITNVPLR